jgi:signal transduction histidine kinase
VFERLYTATRQPERKENSSGLGLAIVRELVTAMGGEVTARNAPTGGARLSFWLPAAP